MTRKRLLQTLFSSAFILFLLVLVLRFRPRIEVPAPVQPEALQKGSEGSLSARGFRHVQQSGGTAEYELTADVVTQAPDGKKLLTAPVIVFPGRGRAWARRGEYDPGRQMLRIWEDARLSDGKDLHAEAFGFRLTPEGEMVSEGPATFGRGAAAGSCDLLRYHRRSQMAHLEGSVRLESGGSTLSCVAADFDLAAHTGVLQGPVKAEGPEGTVEAPEGKILLDEANRLRSLTFLTPATGRGPKGSFSARSATAETGAGGKVERVLLEGDAEVSLSEAPPATMRTARLRLTPSAGGAWTWEAPGALTLHRGAGSADASSGTGRFGGPREAEGRFEGPVRGRDETGTFASDAAELRGADWTLVGNAESRRGAEELKADRITYAGDGSVAASGGARGRRIAGEGRPELVFQADEALAGPGGYPAVLHGKARAERGGLRLEAPHIRLADADTALATDGEARFADAEGQVQTVRAPLLSYRGQDRLAEARDGARAEGRGYWITARTLVARLDAGNRPVRYEAEGDCRFEGPNQEGTSDRLEFDPATRMGRAYGDRTFARVRQRDPKRTAVGTVVAFGPRYLEVLPGESAVARGSLGGTPPPARDPKAPPKDGGAR